MGTMWRGAGRIVRSLSCIDPTIDVNIVEMDMLRWTEPLWSTKMEQDKNCMQRFGVKLLRSEKVKKSEVHSTENGCKHRQKRWGGDVDTRG